MRPVSGFTLAEVIVVVLILGVLAAVAVPRARDMVRDSQINATMSDVNAIADAATNYYAQSGTWPRTTYKNNAPRDFQGYLSPSVFKKKPPVGTSSSYGYVWSKNRNGIKALVYIVNTKRPVDLWRELDRRYDDGNLATGSIYVYSSNYLFFIIDK